MNALRPIDLDDPKAPELLKRAWALVEEWTEIYLDTYPNASPDDVADNLNTLTFFGNAIRLAPNVYAITANYSEIGTFFIVSKNDKGKYRVVWDVKKAEVNADKNIQDELCRWAYLSPQCFFGNWAWRGGVHSLPNSINNNPRFYVDALLSSNGGTLPGQLSIWEWNGIEAIPLLAGQFGFCISDDESDEFDGQFMRIHIKGEFKSFFSNNGSPDPRVIWTIRITPDKVEDLGRKDVVPELSMVDELFYRLMKGMSADELASEEVISEIEAIIEYLKSQIEEDLNLFGELGSWKINEENNKKILYFRTFNLPCKLRFEIEERRGKPYFSNLDMTECENSESSE